MSYIASMNRRDFLSFTGLTSVAGAASLAGFSGKISAATSPPTFSIPPLPYAKSALVPTISEKTVGFHYDKHHMGALNSLNSLITGTKYESMSLERIIKATHGKRLLAGMIFNQAAQTRNHTFYWNSLKPGTGDATPPTGKLLALINAQYGHFSDSTKKADGSRVNPGVKQKLLDAVKNHFGSGWAWVVIRGKKLEIITTMNAETPLALGMTPLLTIDVFEHS